MADERVVRIRSRTVVAVLAIVLAAYILLSLIWAARQVLTWVLVAAFLALAINPLVDWLQRRGIRRRGPAAAVAFVGAIVVVGGLAAALIPTLAGEVADFIDALPEIVRDLTEGRGRLGFLETRYNIVERVEEAVKGLEAGNVLAASGTALAVTKGVVTAVIAAITIVFLTFFMLLEGPAWIGRTLEQLPEDQRGRWRRIGRDIYRTVGGYVSGALIISLIAGVSTSIVLTIAGVPYAFALGLLTALLDLIPLAGATLAAIVVSAVAFLDSVPVGIGVLAFFILYQQFENHVLYPTVYSRTVALSPLAILIAVLIGASLGGILGAIASIPVAGTVQILLREWLSQRRGPVLPAPET
ncbi:MAG: AI-2E family transporter [Gaiellaceae bacterium]